MRGSILGVISEDVSALEAFGQRAKAIGAPFDRGWLVIVFRFESSEWLAFEGDDSLMTNPADV